MFHHGQSPFFDGKLDSLVKSGHLEQVNGQGKMGFWDIMGEMTAANAIIRGLLHMLRPYLKSCFF